MSVAVWYFFQGCLFWISTNDDLRYFCDCLSGPRTALSVVNELSIAQKRPHLGNFPFWYLAYAFDSAVAYSVVIWSALVANAVALGLLGIALTGIRSIWTVICISSIYFLMLSNNYGYSAISFFSPIFTSSISLFCFAVYSYYRAMTARSRIGKAIGFSLTCILLFWTFMTYEVFQLLMPIFLLVQALRFREARWTTLLIPGSAQFLSLLVYVFLRLIPSGQAYAGAVVSSHVDPYSIAKTTLGFSLGAFPLAQSLEFHMKWMRSVYFQNGLFYQPEPYLRLMVGLLVVYGSCLLIRNYLRSSDLSEVPGDSARTPSRINPAILLLSAIYFFLVPCLLPSLTEVYQKAYLNGDITGQVTSFFSWNALVLMIALIIIQSIRGRFRPFGISLCVISVVFLSINSICAYVNTSVTSSLEKEGSDVIVAMKHIASTSPFQSEIHAREKMKVVSEDIGKTWFSLSFSGPATLNPIAERGHDWPKRSFWEYYFSIIGNGNIAYYEDLRTVDPGTQFTYVRYIRDLNRLGHAVTVLIKGSKSEPGDKGDHCSGFDPPLLR